MGYATAPLTHPTRDSVAAAPAGALHADRPPTRHDQGAGFWYLPGHFARLPGRFDRREKSREALQGGSPRAGVTHRGGWLVGYAAVPLTHLTSVVIASAGRNLAAR